MSDMNCPKCGTGLECGGGLSAHRDNWTCPKCDRAAMTTPTPRTDAVYPPELIDREYARQGDSYGWGTLHAMRELARQLERDLAAALERCEKLEEELRSVKASLVAQTRHKPRHQYWVAGEADCPQEIKAPNGELHTLRCKVCGLNNPTNGICRPQGEPR